MKSKQLLMCKKFFSFDIIKYLCNIGYYIRETKKKCYRLAHFYVNIINAESRAVGKRKKI